MIDPDVLDGLVARWGEVIDWTTDPTGWIEKHGENVWSQQRKILESVRDHRYTAVHSAHDLGKSFIASRIIAWWISTHPIGEAFVVSTAPTAAQVSAIMWREVGKFHSKAQLDGRVLTAGYPQWKVGNELIGYGRKPADYEQSAFQGIHARYVLVVIDEACGVNANLFNAVDALATNEFARVVAIGNPDDPGSHFAKVCSPDQGWNVIHLDALRSPNFTKAEVIGHRSAGFGYANPRYPLVRALMEAEGIPYSQEHIPEYMRPMLVHPNWVEERLMRWCGIKPQAARLMDFDALKAHVQSRAAGSALFTSKVRGLFPTSASEGIVPLGWVQLAINRWHDLMDDPRDSRALSLRAHKPGPFTLGIDVARSGDDETVFTHRYGSFVARQDVAHITDTMEIVTQASAHLHEPGSLAVIDVIGIGSGVYDRLRQMKAQGLIAGTPIPFNAAGQDHRQDKLGQFRFRNNRAAAWWHFRELLDPAFGSVVALPDDDLLVEELTSVKFDHFVGGIMRVESKDDIKKRLGRSTDRADSLIQAFWVEGMSAKLDFNEWSDKGGSVIRYEGYDPFTDTDLAASPGFHPGSTITSSPNNGLGMGAGLSDWDI